MPFPQVAYTFDAGPNACLYLLEKDVPLVLALVEHFFPKESKSDEGFIRGLKGKLADVPQVGNSVHSEWPSGLD